MVWNYDINNVTDKLNVFHSITIFMKRVKLEIIFKVFYMHYKILGPY